ncbi:hypothetical protein [Escherichia sp. E13S3]|uniref:hypothetical protein n=1 Tax=Escherichia sp. E13S3 TaxID=2484854 RepID=UPI00102A7492|nr:hypothetical protein [Escherichia sp. E13S3]RZN45906.1 hypothetical protein D9597_18375 [Escherichia sp. E13S3]
MSWTVIHLTAAQKQKPASLRWRVFVEEVKLTDKPLSFGYSVVDSHSSYCRAKAKTRQFTLAGFR